MQRVWLVVLVIGCEAGAPIARGSTAEPKSAQLTQSRSAIRVEPLPPPPPPPPPGPRPPPEVIASFLRDNRDKAGAWHVTLHALGDAPGSFMGAKVERTVVVKPALASQLVARLGSDSSYNDGDYGCIADDIGVRI